MSLAAGASSWLLTTLSRAIPMRTGNELRATLLRARGVDVGEGTLVYGTPDIARGEGTCGDLRIGRDCIIDVACSFDLGGSVTIGDRVTLGAGVMVVTTTHDIGPNERRAGAAKTAAVRIEDGAWIGPRAVVLPGVVVGRGAIVEAASVVGADVPPSTRVRGSPAKAVEELAP